MATSLKTVCFPFPPLASIVDATVTNFTQISVQLPEGSKTFRKVWVECMADDLITVTGGTVGEWRIGLRLGAAGYTTVTQLNDLVHGGENAAPHIEADFTSHFTTNWAGQQSGEVCTCDVQIYLDQTTGTTLNFDNGSALLWVTYEYDDTSTTQVMNAWIPFTSLLGATGTSKPAAQDTIPALDSFLGYGTLSYKHCTVILEGNESNAAGTTNFTLTCQIDSLTAQVGSSHTAALASDRYIREFYNMMSGGNPLFTTNATHSIYLWTSTGAVGRMNHASLTMLVVFTFDATSGNDGNLSLRIPMEYESPMGGTASTDSQRATAELWIEEPTTIAIQKSAYRLHWEQVGTLGGLNFRAGSQSYSAYTDTAAMLCGTNCLQRTVDDNITLARGKNVLTADVYRTDASDLGWVVTGFWIINYKCAKPSDGWGTANRTILWPLRDYGTAAEVATFDVTATAPVIPETNHFLSATGAYMQWMSSTSTQLYGYILLVERLSGEGGMEWEVIYHDNTHTDPVPGLRTLYSQDGHERNLFKKYPTDPTPNRFDFETNRRWRFQSGRQNAAQWFLGLIFTYHSISWTVTRAITGSAGGTVNIEIYRILDKKLIATASRTGNGNYTFTSYDTVHPVFADVREDATHIGRSENFTAS